ncbi:sodium-dependent proline transporter [Trichonephila clavata]|uniref:Transporter n=1 Tax=Trichonephila clavata TaxID=2740835 RepID=A0A8X6IS82_TRICU|nr:sodium-dependent proline transporter [Trichonephila clavata]
MFNLLSKKCSSEGCILDAIEEERISNVRAFRETLLSENVPPRECRHRVYLPLKTFEPENELEKDFPRVSSQVPLSPRGDEDDRSYQYSEAEVERGTWTGKFDFLLSLLGYSVGLGNVWRFPYLCYSNGGGAFLIPFICMMLLAGLPLMFMELSFGQYASLGPIAIFERFCPLFSGLGYGMVIVSGTVMLYYNMIIAWTIFYMFASWNSRLPWEHCAPEWSTFVLRRAFGEVYGTASTGIGESLPQTDLIIFTNGGPVPDYLLRSPYKIVPFPNPDFARRLDDASPTFRDIDYESRNSTGVDDLRRKTTRNYLAKPSIRKRNNSRRQKNKSKLSVRARNIERYVQQVKSPDGVVAIPIKPSQKGQSISNFPQNVDPISAGRIKDPVFVNNVLKKTTLPSFIMPTEKFPTQGISFPMPVIDSTKPSFVTSPKLVSPNALYKFPKPATKVKESPLYETKPYFQPYSFGYDVFDGYGTKQYRQETASNDGVITGNYGYKDFQGIYRQVQYTADENGFRAVLKSNEPGLANVDTADVSVSVEPPPV